jgi:hypothetical protein
MIGAPPTSGLYVFAIVRAADGPLQTKLTGVGTDPEPVRAVTHEGLSAIVSEVPTAWRAAARSDVEIHDRVLSELVGRAVVPMRFGIVVTDEDELRNTMAAHADGFAEMLDHVDGRVQMSVKAYYRDEALLRAVLARRPDLKQRADALEQRPVLATQNERIALGRDVAAAVEEQQALDQQAVVEPLAQLAADVRIDPGRSERHAFSLQLLVDADARARLDAVVQRLAAEHDDRLVLRYVGPLAPYSFCEESLDAGGRPWG